MAYEPGYFASRVRIFLAGLAVVGHYLAGTALTVIDRVFLDPMRWLFAPDAQIELELRGLDRVTRDSLHLESDKRKKAFIVRERAHSEFYGGSGFMPDYAL